MKFEYILLKANVIPKIILLLLVIIIKLNIWEGKFLPYKGILQITVRKLRSAWFENTKRLWKKIKWSTIKKEKYLKDKDIWMNITMSQDLYLKVKMVPAIVFWNPQYYEFLIEIIIYVRKSAIVCNSNWSIIL